MNIQEILDLYDKTAFLPFGMAELLLEREAELVKGKEVPAPSLREVAGSSHIPQKPRDGARGGGA